jgi:gluconolactonase
MKPLHLFGACVVLMLGMGLAAQAETATNPAPQPDLLDSSWIWYPEGNPAIAAPPGKRFFRRQVDLPAGAKLTRAVMRLAVQDGFTLYVNGRPVFQSLGIVDDWKKPKEIDLTRELSPGTNAIAVAAVHLSGPDGKPTPAGLIGKLTVELDGSKPLIITTDKQWKAFDKPLEGWTKLKFDDKNWPDAMQVAALGQQPWGDSPRPDRAPAGVSAESAMILAEGAKLEKLADGFLFTEGPACDRDGNIYFTDQPNDRIMIWSVDGKLSEFMKPCGRSNGLCFDGNGNLIACADQTNQLWQIDVTTKTNTVLVKDFGGKLLNGPNDVWVAPSGALYFTDPYYQRDYWNRGPKEQDVEGVYYLSPDGNHLTRVVDDMTRPNGIIGTPDGKTLYISDIDGKKTWSYAINPDGSLSNKHLFCEMGSDGMTIDDAGNVYLTNHGVTAFDKTGKQVLHIDIPDEKWTGNICFGGKDRQMLFITASKGIYAIRTRTKGVGSQ